MQDDVDEWQHALPNAFMASAPGDDFWLFVLQMIIERTATEEMRSGAHPRSAALASALAFP